MDERNACLLVGEVVRDPGDRRRSQRFHERGMLGVEGHSLVKNVRVILLGVRGQPAEVVGAGALRVILYRGTDPELREDAA